MKLFVLLLVLFAANTHAEIYKCGQSYSQTPCGNDATIMKFENAVIPNAAAPLENQSRAFESKSSGAKNTKSITGKVVRVADGDTITVETYSGKEKIRFAQIDAPETSHFGSKPQPYGKEAGAYLRQLVLKKNARVDVEAVDQYGRNVGTVYIGGTNINREMVKNGYAWAYRQYLHDSTLMDLEKAARSNRIGLWTLDNPIYPPDFRKANK